MMVSAPMPSVLPDIKTDHPRDGGPYLEGNTYTWPDGTQATIRNGEWQAVKRRNTICERNNSS